MSLDLLLQRIGRFAWRLASVGFIAAATLVLLGGLVAGRNRSMSDALVLAGFGLFLPALALGWVGLMRNGGQSDGASETAEVYP